MRITKIESSKYFSYLSQNIVDHFFVSSTNYWAIFDGGLAKFNSCRMYWNVLVLEAENEQNVTPQTCDWSFATKLQFWSFWVSFMVHRPTQSSTPTGLLRHHFFHYLCLRASSQKNILEEMEVGLLRKLVHECLSDISTVLESQLLQGSRFFPPLHHPHTSIY